MTDAITYVAEGNVSDLLIKGGMMDSKRAFTLIELMLVVIIIGVLAAMVVPNLVGRSEQARSAAARADIASLSSAVDMFEMDNGRYPATEEGLAALRKNPGDLPNWKKPYIKKDPKDPWGKPYLYKTPGTHNEDYDIYSAGPNGIEGDKDDIGNW
jgi:general secretion pathway protein G